MSDTGLLMSMVEGVNAAEIITGPGGGNFGFFMENAVASALHKKGYPLRYYSKPDSTLEIDFVLDRGDGITLMEVKSGMSRRSKSLSTLMGQSSNRHGVKLADSQISRDEKGVVHYPLYAVCFLPGAPVPDVAGPDVEGINRRYSELHRSPGTVMCQGPYQLSGSSAALPEPGAKMTAGHLP